MAARPFSAPEFSDILEKDFAAVLKGAKALAVGVSGGPDSMALVSLLSGWAARKKVKIHAITVDHGLRKESAKEAKAVAQWLTKAPSLLRGEGWGEGDITHVVLRWKGAKPKARLMEEARAARYRLMGEYCAKHKIKYLFLAHHQDDQAETFLFRLAKGSGLDGLAGMRRIQVMSPSPQPSRRRGERAFIALRPLLGIPKERLVATCKNARLKFIKDPSNEAQRFARPRLRKARKILEEEGLSSKRLATTAMRLDRARKSLENIAKEEFKKSLVAANSKRIVLKSKVFLEGHEEIAFRLLVRAIHDLRPEEDYLPRMEKIEAIFCDIVKNAPFRKRTLGGLVFERNDRKKQVTISVETGRKI